MATHVTLKHQAKVIAVDPAWTASKEEDKPPRYYVEKVSKTIEQVTRDNIPYLKGKANLPVYQALKGLVGF
ncbi:hypothetical protein HUR95_01205 [Caldalkalibacillus thermarum TA2.A1]|uniref:Uncharacterized protein n=1 Tax=Caldalkalibacillus thermarum (strain TA2.A1) TaxID=986075 RepID=A0A8X8LAQ0_CALTT|nr:hypothetical protein [Caldalkalibacillus thermarum]QZT34083.1 hypothetical protein HUR95_01205 [Caldalkalibacillus thermarum TA2.A1]GGK30090.1 hypothetical protein GCM10010965_23670 [Caldalkalibacillus thermarum]